MAAIKDTFLGYFAAQIMAPLVKHRVFGEEYLLAGDYLLLYQGAYDTGVALGFSLRNDAAEFVRLFCAPGHEDELLKCLHEVAQSHIDEGEGHRKSLFDVCFVREARRLFPDFPTTSPPLQEIKLPVRSCFGNLQMAIASGVGLGMYFPGLAQQLWQGSYGAADAEQWQQARNAGLDLPESPPVARSLAQEASVAKPLLVEFLRRFRPDLEHSFTTVLNQSIE